ncbi:MAG TPA: glutamine amidotransferase [Pyrinomonadaceae bacterium]|nr:glutamine amidotransferase [Pyrinomonadaceae bacterium]
MDTLVRFLFGHEQAVFSNGRFGFDVRPGALLLVLIFLLAAVFIYFIYLRPRIRLSKRTTATLIALRAALLAVMIVLLLRPVVVVSSVIPRSSYVAVVVDDSQSMKLRDEGNGADGNATRLDTVKQVLLNTGAGQTSFLNRLDQKFKTNLYGFSGGLSRLKDANDLFGEGRTSDVAGALEETIKRSSGMPLSAIVLATDGASNVPSDITNTLRELRARDIPVFTIGVGNTTKPLDAELTRINMPRRVLVGSRVNIETFVGLSGYNNTKVLLGVREDGRAIKTEQFDLRGNETQAINLEITPATPGVHRYTVEITPLDGELTIDNNKQDAVVEVIEGPLRLLHVEGEPRWELGKIRESLALNEKNVIIVSLQRTGENKFYRQGIGSQTELAGGFPQTEEELFAYDGLVIGSVEAGFFSADQLRSIEAFVARRGGGLLALGGRLSFDGGKYKGTALDDLLPLSLTGASVDDINSFAPVYKPLLTSAGQAHPITRLHEDRAANQKTWNELPPISVSQALTSVKPGATVLLEARKVDGAGAHIPLLVHQRYGRGQTLALTASDTWRWRMRMDSKNNAHETFWRQMLRYVVSNTPRQVEITTAKDVYAVDETVNIVADVRDKKFNPVGDAQATARVTKPSGATVDVPLKFTTLNAANIYTGEFRADELGQHRIELIGNSTTLGQLKATANVLVSDLNREYYSAAQNSDLLKRIAAETGGKYYTPEQTQSLLDDLTYRQTPYSERVTKDLWDMPVNFMVLIGLLSAEWFQRKLEGLA